MFSGEALVPPTTSTKYVASVVVTDGVIKVTPNAIEGFAATDFYQLTPTYTAGQPLTWSIAGSGCLTRQLCK